MTEIWEAKGMEENGVYYRLIKASLFWQARDDQNNAYYVIYTMWSG